MVLCADACDENAPKIELTQTSPTTLRCNKKLYEIDEEYRSTFRLVNCIAVHPKPDGLYTMFYIRGGSCEETWHKRLKSKAKK